MNKYKSYKPFLKLKNSLSKKSTESFSTPGGT